MGGRERMQDSRPARKDTRRRLELRTVVDPEASTIEELPSQVLETMEG